MKLSPTAIRRFREARNWSQEQLASASGLSLRTIQRVETAGTASRETRVCLAAAFGVDVGALAEVKPDAAGAQAPDTSMAFSLVGAAMLLAALLAGAPFVIHYLGGLFLLFGLSVYVGKRWLPGAKDWQ